MKKKVISELIWLVGLFVLAFLMAFIPGNHALDINMHGTYIMVDGHTYTPTLYSYPLALFIIILCLVYFIRCLLKRFTELVTDVGLLISTAIALFFFSDIILIFTVSQMHFAAMPGLRHWFYYLRIVLMMVLVLDVFMIGGNWKNSFNRDKTLI